MSNAGVHIETTATACWLLMDATWMLGYASTGTILGILSLSLFIICFRFLPRRLADWCIHIAVFCWVLMNLLWMLGEQFALPVLRTWAIVAVVISLLCLLFALWQGGLGGAAAQRFRRLRLATPSPESPERTPTPEA